MYRLLCDCVRCSCLGILVCVVGIVFFIAFSCFVGLRVGYFLLDQWRCCVAWFGFCLRLRSVLLSLLQFFGDCSCCGRRCY